MHWRSSKWKLIVIIILFLGILISLRNIREGFASVQPGIFKYPIVDSSIKDSEDYNKIMESWRTNCRAIGSIIGQVQRVANKILNIQNQLNSGAINLQNAREQLDYVRKNDYNCGENPNSIHCNATSELMTALKTAMSSSTYNFNYPVSSLNNNMPTTVKDINNFINLQWYKVNEFYTILQKLQISLRCNLFTDQVL
jgi:hypothetical protein